MWLRPAFALLACAGCAEGPLDCTLASCSDGFVVVLGELPGADDVPGQEPALPAGDYEIEVSLDETRLLCSYSVPDGERAGCAGDGAAISVITGRFVGSPSRGFRVSGERTPRDVSAVLRHQGLVLAEYGFQLEYQPYAPNGEVCGPVCLRAERQLPLPLPP